MLKHRRQLADRNGREIPIGPGIKGDYFECNELMLIQKLDALRASDAHFVPSLLERYYSDPSLGTDDPDNFINDIWMFLPRDAVEMVSDNEKISLGGVEDASHSSERSPVAYGDAYNSNHNSNNKNSPSPERGKGGSVAASLKSWEGTEIFITNDSSYSPPSSPNSSESPKSVGKFSEAEISSTPLGKGTARPSSRSSNSYANTGSTETAASISTTAQSEQSSRSTAKSPKTTATAKTVRRGSRGTPLINYVIDEDATHDISNVPFLSLEESFHLGSASSSVHDDDQPHNQTEKQLSARKTRLHHRYPNTSTSSSVGNPSGIVTGERLHMQLQDQDDMRDFKRINNFSYDGDCLLSRILRESTRIQMKKDMLNSEKELYLQVTNPVTPKTGEEDRKVLFSI
jgi:hypothetical protein